MAKSIPGSWRNPNQPLLAALGTLVLGGLLYWLHQTGAVTVPGLEIAEEATLDARFHLRGGRTPRSDDIVIVGLDDETRRRAPELFQKRSGWARLIAAVGRGRPQAIGLDALFDSPEQTLPRAVVAKVRAARDRLAPEIAEPASTPASAPALPAPTPAHEALAALDAVLEETRGDERLARAITEAKVVYAGALLFVGADESTDDATPEPPGLRGARLDEVVASGGAARSRRPPHARAGALTALPLLAAGLRGAGVLNTKADEDGGMRRAFTVLERGGRYYAPLGLVLARARLGGELSYVVGEEVLHLAGRELPVDRRGVAILDYLGPARTFRHVSAIDLVEGKLAPDTLAGKTVIVGLTDTVRDVIKTPFDPAYPGVEMHATLLHNALFGELLVHVTPARTLALVGLFGGLMALLLLRPIRTRMPRPVIVLSFLLVVAWVVLAYVLFRRGVVLDVVAPTASLLLVLLVSLAVSLIVEGQEKRELRRIFGEYLDRKALNVILADPARLRLGGERRELTVLFSDIRGFTGLSEDLDPQQVVHLLNEYLTPMTEQVWVAGGLLDKYIGDAIMAIYGAPLDEPDHATRACRSALAMQANLEILNRAWRAAGLPALAVGIGVNSGPMSVGNMGSAQHKSYTVIGDAVNLGARLEGLTKEYAAHILVGEQTYTLARGAFRFRELDLVRVKGKDRPARVYELLGDAASAPEDEPFALALAAYRRRDWPDAESRFGALAAARPDDGPVRIFLERVTRLKDEALPADWDGVYEQHAK